MSIIFEKLLNHSNDLKSILSKFASLSAEPHPFDWENVVYNSDSIRRAHLDVVDARESKKLYMMHLCIFPQIDNNSPIFGFDLIAGSTKVTGAFLDFSPVDSTNHQMSEWFESRVKDYEWSKKRNLPDWAKNIFSDNMVAAGNIQSDAELDEILTLSKDCLEYYLTALSDQVNTHTGQYKDQQNKYCQNQKLNPHTPKVMSSLGLDPSQIKVFIEECLFPEIRE